jgi:hypothetical protein
LFSTAQNEARAAVETAALVSRAEELLVLTRGMKELWLRGGLETLDGGANGEGKIEGRDVEEGPEGDVRRVVELLRESEAVEQGNKGGKEGGG